MNIKQFAAAVGFLCLTAGAAGAQSFEGQADDAARSFKAQAAQIQQDSTYAKSIVCSALPKGALMGDSIRVYTLLGGAGPRESLPEEGKGLTELSSGKSAPKDETRLNDYNAHRATRTKLHVESWSCDTQDYSLSFDMDGLVRSSQQVLSQPVKGHARVETRGQKEFEGDFSCTAFW